MSSAVSGVTTVGVIELLLLPESSTIAMTSELSADGSAEQPAAERPAAEQPDEVAPPPKPRGRPKKVREIDDDFSSLGGMPAVASTRPAPLNSMAEAAADAESERELAADAKPAAAPDIKKLLEAFNKLSQIKGRDAAVGILQRFGVKSVRELDEADQVLAYASVLKALK